MGKGYNLRSGHGYPDGFTLVFIGVGNGIGILGYGMEGWKVGVSDFGGLQLFLCFCFSAYKPVYIPYVRCLTNHDAWTSSLVCIGCPRSSVEILTPLA